MTKNYILLDKELDLLVDNNSRIILNEMIFLTDEIFKVPRNKIFKIPLDAIFIIGIHAVFPDFHDKDIGSSFRFTVPVVRASTDCSVGKFVCDKSDHRACKKSLIRIQGTFKGEVNSQMLWDDLHPTEHKKIAEELGIDKNFAWVCHNIHASNIIIKEGHLIVPKKSKIYLKENVA